MVILYEYYGMGEYVKYVYNLKTLVFLFVCPRQQLKSWCLWDDFVQCFGTILFIKVFFFLFFFRRR